MTASFHIDIRDTKRKLAVHKNNNNLLPFCTVPTYLRVKLDRLLKFRNHIEALRKKLKSRVAQLKRLARSGWSADAKTLLTAALSMVYTSDYCAPVWCCSAHTLRIDSVLNDAMCIVTGCLRPTPKYYSPILAGI